MLQPRLRLVCWLLLFDALFIFAYLVSKEIAALQGDGPTWYSIRFSPDTDGGFPELYQYVKWISAAVVFVAMARVRNRWHELAWALAFTYFFFDDAFRVHERLGGWAALWLQEARVTGLRPQDLGELSVSLVAACFLAMAILFACKTGTREFRKMSIDLALLVGALFVVGVAGDMLNIYLENTVGGWKLAMIMNILEDGGEMVVASVFVGFTYWMYRNPHDADNRLSIYVQRPWMLSSAA